MGTRTNVLRIISAVALVVLLAAGCGGSARSQRASPHLPRALAQQWAREASTIADVAAAGDSCRASQLAASLRDDVIAAQGEVPARLQAPLVAGVNALADRIKCTPPTTKTHPPPPKHPPHDHHKHDHHANGGDQGGQS
jgi:hypothetical protein